MKKLLLALGIGIAVFAAVFASAASLGLVTDDLGADDMPVNACATGVGVTYQPIYNQSAGTYVVNTITVTGLSACVGQEISATLSGTGNAALFTTVPVAIDTATEIFAVLPTVVPAEDVLDVHVVISGP